MKIPGGAGKRFTSGVSKSFPKIGSTKLGKSSTNSQTNKGFLTKTSSKGKNNYQPFSASSADENDQNEIQHNEEKHHKSPRKLNKRRKIPTVEDEIGSDSEAGDNPDITKSKSRALRLKKAIRKVKSFPILSADYSGYSTTNENSSSVASEQEDAGSQAKTRKSFDSFDVEAEMQEPKSILRTGHRHHHHHHRKHGDGHRETFSTNIITGGGIQYKFLLLLLFLLAICSTIGIIFVPIGDQISKRYSWYNYEPYVTSLIVTFGLSSACSLILVILLVLTQLRRLQKHAANAFTLVLIVVTLIFTFIAFICSLVQQAKLSTIFGDEFQQVFERYFSQYEDKIIVDRVQIEFECCGFDSFEDWNEIVNDEVYENSFAFAPFSCCDMKSIRPCIHENMQIDNPALNYKFPEDMTLNRNGCRACVQDYYKEFILVAISLSTSYLILEIGIFIICFFSYK